MRYAEILRKHMSLKFKIEQTPWAGGCVYLLEPWSDDPYCMEHYISEVNEDSVTLLSIDFSGNKSVSYVPINLIVLRLDG